MSFPLSGNDNRRQQCMIPYPFLRQFDVASSRCLDDLGEKENKFQLYDDKDDNIQGNFKTKSDYDMLMLVKKKIEKLIM